MTQNAAPDVAALAASVRAAMARQDNRATQAELGRLLRLYPNYAGGWLLASIFELRIGQAPRALQAAERGLALGAAEPALLVQRVRCLHAAGCLREARQAARDSEARLADAPQLLHELGNAYGLLGETERAAALMQRAARILPNDAALAYNYAAMLRFLGRFNEAEAQLDRAIALAPADWEAYGTRSQLRVQTATHNHIDQLEARLAAGIPGWAGQVQIRYALAKEYEDIGAYEKSFAHLAAGAALRRRHLQYDVAGDLRAINEIITCFARPAPDSGGAAPAGPTPIFVFGLPRSGTTLVDRILSSHSDVVSCGELNDFPASVIACASGGAPAAKQDLIRRAAAVDPARIGAAYMARVARLEPAGAFFIDKLPMNYLYAGLIAAALPAARLVLVRRHAMANGYGMFKTLFQQGYPFSYDLDDLGRYIAAYMRLVAHWRGVLGERLICVRYEDLVASQETETRRLVAACGLEWDPACLSPQRNAAPSQTQSAVQIRRPVYREAVDAWRRYEAQLAPLARRLAEEGVESASF